VADREIDAVVFDYGGVLTTPLRVSTPRWLAADRITQDSFTEVMRDWLGRDAAAGSPVHRLETGELPGVDFERLFAARLVTEDGTPVVASGLLRRLFAGMAVDEAMVALVRDLRAAGLRLGLLSNSWANTYPDELLALFDAVVISGEVGLRKPDPVIYRLVLDKLAVPAARSVFVDDVAVNVAAATELGMHAVRHHDAEQTRTALSELIPALAKPAEDVTE
jgi:putative hydrolase of the HAD superfamily